MANSAVVYARIDPQVKEDAESILRQLGITPSAAVQMLYRQIVLTRGMPLNLHLPSGRPTAIGGMSREEINAELEKGIASMRNGNVYSLEEADAMLAREFKL